MPLYKAGVGAGGAGGILLSQQDARASDTTTNSATFVDLLSASFTLQNAGDILVIIARASISGNDKVNSCSARITVDTVAKQGAYIAAGVAVTGGSFILTERVTGLSAGAHTIALQWKTSGGTLSCRPVAAVDSESASILCLELQT